MAQLIPNLKVPTRDELAAVLCAARAGHGVGPEMAERMAARIRDLESGLARTEGQLAEALAAEDLS